MKTQPQYFASFLPVALLASVFCFPLLGCAEDTVCKDAKCASIETTPKADVGEKDLSVKRDVSKADVFIYTDAASDGGISDGPLKAFPTAFGGGAEASGGRGGVLIIINTPDPNVPLTHFPTTDSTPERYEGGFYAALQHDGAAYLTFDRSMNIRQSAGGTGTVQFSGLGITGVQDKTIFGQSAPMGGITITGGTLTFNGRSGPPTKNLIFRYFRSRPILDQNGTLTTEPDLYTWGLLFRAGEDIIVDHCSFSFAQDKGLGGAAREPGIPFARVTFSRNFVSDTHTGIYVEVNPNREGDPEEDVDRISFLSNMTSGMNRTPNVAFDGFAEVLNSVIYGNTYKSTTMYHDLRINFMNNYYLGPESGGRPGYNRVFDHEGVVSIHASGNHFPGLLEGKADENNEPMFKFKDEYDSTIDSSYFVPTPFDSPNPHNVDLVSADDAFASVVTSGNIGANRYLDDDGKAQTYHDPYDASQLEAIRTGADVPHDDVQFWVLPIIPETIRPETYDTDKDGIADAWELRVIGDLSQSYNDDHDNDGYRNIEEFMNQVDQ